MARTPHSLSANNGYSVGDSCRRSSPPMSNYPQARSLLSILSPCRFYDTTTLSRARRQLSLALMRAKHKEICTTHWTDRTHEQHLQSNNWRSAMYDQKKPPTSERKLADSRMSPSSNRYSIATRPLPCLESIPRTLQRMVLRGQIVGVQVGKLWRFRASAIGEWIETRNTRWLD